MEGRFIYGHNPNTGRFSQVNVTNERGIRVLSRPADAPAYWSDGTTTSGVIKTGPGVYWTGALFTSPDAVSRVLMLFDATSLPADGSAPMAVSNLLATGMSQLTMSGLFAETPFTTGLFWALSVSSYALNQTGITASAARIFILYE